MFYLKDVSLLRKGVAGNPGSAGQKGEVGYPGPFVSDLNFSAYEGMDESPLCHFHVLYFVTTFSGREGAEGTRGCGMDSIIIPLG